MPLGAQPQPWKPEDSFLVIGAMYLDLNGDGRNQRELSFAQMRSALPSPLVDFLLAPDPEWEAPLSGDLSHPPVIPGADDMPMWRPPLPQDWGANRGNLQQRNPVFGDWF